MPPPAGLRRGVQDVAQTLDGDADLLEVLPHLGELQHRLRDRWANMFKATSSPTVNSLPITSSARQVARH